jgi:hypothetical protein
MPLYSRGPKPPNRSDFRRCECVVESRDFSPAASQLAKIAPMALTMLTPSVHRFVMDTRCRAAAKTLPQ